LGWSLSGGKSFGKPFNDDSDLDFSIISDGLFGNVVADFDLWKSKLNRGEEKFINKYGPENLARLPANISRGFIDPYKIDYHPYLDYIRLLTNTQSYGRQKLQSTEGAPSGCKLSIRIYADFEAFVRQMKLNLDTTLSSF
jgi:hypothetical protein